MTDVELHKVRSLHNAAIRAAKAVDRECLRAREKGATWTEIGYALGISAQAAQKRYGTGSERHQATLEAQAAAAIRNARKKARRAKSG